MRSDTPARKDGPYHQLSYRRRGVAPSRTSAPNRWPPSSQIVTYHELRDFIDEWIDAAVQLDRLRRAQIG
ncbi:MAG: hypothetical protein LC721_05850 [Actinobacteria bacterium]|nr:hypothetical protein [Actinomycetota bacterium]